MRPKLDLELSADVIDAGSKLASAAVGSAAAPRQPRWAGVGTLIWAEWYAHSWLLLGFLLLWLLAVWVLPLVAHPGWILLLGAIYALLAGPIYGGQDVLHACEEFSLSQPITRTERYLIRLGVGLGSLFFICALDLLALGIDLPQVLGRLYVQTGLVQPVPAPRTHLLYGLIAAAPFAAFAVSFALAAAGHARTLVLTAWLWGGIGCLACLQSGLWLEEQLWDQMNGFASLPMVLLLGVVALALGLRVYERKEIAPHARPLAIPGRWWAWILFSLVGLTLALLLIASLARQYPKLFGSP
jgi:hypothetical protein